jgi:hypothetical protein
MPGNGDIPVGYEDWARRYFGETFTEATAVSNGPEGTATPAAAAELRSLWDSAVEAAMDGVRKIEAALRMYKTPVVLKAADVLDELVEAFPNGIEGALEALDGAENAGDAGGIASARAEVRSGAQDCIEFLDANADLIKICEENPYGVKLPVSADLKRSLEVILDKVG